jgi:hypothetical protein
VSRELLTYSNLKTSKSVELGWLTAIVHFAPAALSGYEVCKGRSKGCTAVCLNSAGHGGIGAKFDAAGKLLQANGVQTARIRRTRMFFEQREAFFALLVRELRLHLKRAARMGLKPACRLNGTSDIAWESEAFTLDGVEYSSIFAAFPQIQFYDYTKRIERMQHSIPNYHLTYSRAETLASKIHSMQVLQSGGNVSAVFRKALPETWNGYRVIDGVSHDLRFLDAQNVIVGLVAKGKARKSTNGFVIDVAA